MLRHQPERRPFILARAGFAGTHRYAATWTGDNTQSSRTGTPLLRPMFLEFPDEPKLARNAEQFMFGAALLVAPRVWDSKSLLVLGDRLDAVVDLGERQVDAYLGQRDDRVEPRVGLAHEASLGAAVGDDEHRLLLDQQVHR